MKDKWKTLFNDMNFNRRWVSKQLGCSLAQLSNAINGQSSLPKKSWAKIVEITNGYITMGDLYRTWLKDLKDKGAVEVIDGEDPWTCIIKEKPTAE